MAGDRAHFPHGDEAAEAIALMNNAHQGVIGWIQTMTDADLERVKDSLRRMANVVGAEVLRRIGVDDG